MPNILHRVGVGVGVAVDFGFCRMRGVGLDADERVRWHCVSGPPEWLATEVSFELVWKEGQTYVLFRHADWKDPIEEENSVSGLACCSDCRRRG